MGLNQLALIPKACHRERSDYGAAAGTRGKHACIASRNNYSDFIYRCVH